MFLAGKGEEAGVFLWINSRNNLDRGSPLRFLAEVSREDLEGITFFQEHLLIVTEKAQE